MTEPVIAQKEPYQVDLEEGKSYAWCACGRSKAQPFCDGSHKGTGFVPHVWKADESKTVWLCGCKRTDGKPFCDGTHNSL
ncbi:MAG: CDGSH iron-sulfur domain-containing protein [Hyphomicrobiales bacterium]|nr:CDGSH iron-sulfur domain-containing protein [Hyphomicrobiales bacterium]